MTPCISQLNFSFYRNQPVRVDFSGGQITSEAGLLPLRAFDERHHLSRDWAACLSDPRQQDRVEHQTLALLRQRVYQIVAGYEDVNDATRLRHDPLLQIVADQKLGDAPGSQPILTRWENWVSAQDLVRLNDLLLEQFIRLCGQQVRQRGEILLDIDSTDDPTHGQQQLSFYNLVNLFRLQLPQPWRSAQIETLRARLFKIGARVRQTARCLRIHLASGWPFQDLFYSATLAINSS